MSRCWSGETVIRVSFQTTPQLRERPEGMFCLEDGPLLFAVAPQTQWTMVEYERNGVERKFPYCDYHIRATSAWNYAFAGETFAREERPVGDIPFSPNEPGVILKAHMAQIPWNEENGACTPKPESLKPLAPPVELELIPYGCTTLRMTEMPMIN